MNMIKLRTIHSIHSWWKSTKIGLASAYTHARMFNTNVEIRIVGSSGRQRPFSFCDWSFAPGSATILCA